MPELVRTSEPQGRFDRAYPKPLREAESELIAKRREALGSRCYPPGTTKASGSGVFPDSVGLALSGGGIRSATFALGVLQALARHGLLPRVDFLSTVSGGGYIGSFLGALIQRNPEAGAGGSSPRSVPGVLRAAQQLEDAHSWPVRWLRESGRYLSPNGAGDERVAAAVFLRNWVAIQAVLGTTLLAALAALQLVRAVAGRAAAGSPIALGFLGPVLWWSPWLLVGLGVLALLGVPLGWAYWLTQRDGGHSRRLALENVMPVAGTMVVALAAAAAAWLDPRRRIALATLSFLALAALVIWGTTRSLAAGLELEARAPWQRNHLSRRFSSALWVAFLASALGLADSLGQTLYWRWASPASFAATGLLTLAGLSPVVVWARRLAALLKPRAGRGPSLGRSAVVAALATAVSGAYVVLASALVHSVSWRMDAGRPLQLSLDAAAALFGVSLGLCILMAPALKFINLSSHQALYAARLVRAYLGASNPRRREDAKARSVGDPVKGDEIDLAGYVPHKHGGPIHLINVTLNETVRGESQIQYRDRKGLALAVGPAGLSAGVSHHALWADGRRDRVRPVYWTEQGQPRPEFHLFAGEGYPAEGVASFTGQAARVEALPLGTWVSISGAAFTTGLGSRTSLALSLLLGLLNVRLGYWWDSGIDPARRTARVRPGGLARVGDLLGRVFPVQSHLLQELLARFHGPNRRRWYLSDGGHFENTGCYELIRRRVPLIVLSDAGQDPRLQLEDLANLVRKVRIDFGAEVRFLDAEEIQERVPAPVRPFIGSLEEMATAERGDKGQRSRVGALLAEIDYPDRAAGPAPARSILLVIKPRIGGGEPADVRHYHASHPAFPHEPTTDQYFDEAQWESYRALGYHIGERLFADGTLWGHLSAVSRTGHGEAHPVASLATAAAG